LTIVGGLALATTAVAYLAEALPAGTPPAGSMVLNPTSGNSGTPIALTFAQAPQFCPGDAVANYRWTTFIVPRATDVASMTFTPSGNPQAPAFSSALRTAVPGGQLVRAQNPGLGDGLVVPPLSIDFANIGFSTLTPGEYTMGIACTLAVNGVVENQKYWTVPVVITASEGAGPNNFTYAVDTGHGATTTTTLPPTTVPPTTTAPPTTTTVPPTTTAPPTTTTVPSTTTAPPTTTTVPLGGNAVRGGFTVVAPTGPCISVRNTQVSFGELLAGSSNAVPGDIETVVTSCANESLRVNVKASDAIARPPATASLRARTCTVPAQLPGALQCGSQISSNEFGYASAATGGAAVPAEVSAFSNRSSTDLSPGSSLNYRHFVQAPGRGAQAQQFDFVITYTATAK
jgi:hypothetical protein